MKYLLLRYNKIINIMLSIMMIVTFIKNLIGINNTTLYFNPAVIIYLIIYLLLVYISNYIYENKIIIIKIKRELVHHNKNKD